MHWQNFFAGLIAGIALVTLVLPWFPRLQRVLARASLATMAGLALAAVAAVVALRHPAAPAMSAAAQTAAAPSSFVAAARALNQASAQPAGSAGSAGSAGPAGPMGASAAGAANAGSMDTAIASLAARLAKGGGTPDDWELLAKSYEFLGRPAEAARARAHQLPAAGEASKAAAPAGVSVTGSVTLDPALAARAKAGETIFIIAKSPDAPGPPLAVFRTTVGTWPLSFTLDDSLSMMPGRNLSGAHRVLIEARISSQGQPLASPGDLQGSSAVIDPATAKPLSIRIDKVLP